MFSRAAQKSIVSSSRRLIVPSSSSSLVSVANPFDINNRNNNFSTKPKVNGTTSNSSDKNLNLSYSERKEKAKELRAKLYHERQERKEKRKTRRSNNPMRGALKKEFNDWFQPKRVWMEVQERKARQAKKDWKIKIACVVERYPVVTPDREKWEIEWDELEAQVEKYKGKMYPADTPFAYDEEDDYPITDEETIAQIPFENLRPGSRVTEADEKNDTKSLDRKLPQSLYLLMKSTLAKQKQSLVDDFYFKPNSNEDDDFWLFPTVTVSDPKETFLAAAKRAVSEYAGDKMELLCLGNAPMAVDMKIYNNSTEEYFGEKIFYYRVQLLDGDSEPSQNKVVDYAWLTKEEVIEILGEERGIGSATLHHYLLCK